MGNDNSLWGGGHCWAGAGLRQRRRQRQPAVPGRLASPLSSAATGKQGSCGAQAAAAQPCPTQQLTNGPSWPSCPALRRAPSWRPLRQPRSGCAPLLCGLTLFALVPACMHPCDDAGKGCTVAGCFAHSACKVRPRWCMGRPGGARRAAGGVARAWKRGVGAITAQSSHRSDRVVLG
jgi:hypothetical protein